MRTKTSRQANDGGFGPAHRRDVFGECGAGKGPSKFAPLSSLRPATSPPVLAEGKCVNGWFEFDGDKMLSNRVEFFASRDQVND